MENNNTTYFAETTFRNLRKKFGIKLDDRRRHIYVIGKTGMGKTVMMENMVIQDIQRGNGVGVVDPHGEFAEKMLDFVPSHRVNDVVYFNPADIDYPVGFNVMEKVDPKHRHLVASGVLGVFKKIWVDVWSARMEYILNNAILALLEYPGSTLLGINRMLADKDYRAKVVNKVLDPEVKAFWITEYARYAQQYATEATAAIQNKVGQFVANPLIRNIVGQTKSSFDMRKIMDERKILIMNLSKGKVGEENSRLLGAMLITKLYLAAMSRVDVPEEQREDMYLYVDEFQNFATESFANILSEARKYRLCLTLGHQYVAQMEEEVGDAVFGNVGTMVVFRIGAEDAEERFEKEFSPKFMMNDLVNLPKYNICLKLMIDGIAGPAFSAKTLPPFPRPQKSSREKIIKVSRERYGVSKEMIEKKIVKWRGFLPEGKVTLPAEAPLPPKLYSATCSSCGKDVRVVFEPDPKRPVYCEKCLKQVRGQKIGRSDDRETGERGARPSFRAESGAPRRYYPGARDSQGFKSSAAPRKLAENQAGISLGEAIKKGPVYFTKPPRLVEKAEDSDRNRERSKVNLGELRKVLEESLGKPPGAVKDTIKSAADQPEVQENGSQRKVLRPGERITF